MGARRILCSRLSSTRIDARAGLLPGWTAIACQSSLRALPASVLQTASCAYVLDPTPHLILIYPNFLAELPTYSPPLPKPASTKKLNAMSPKPTNVSVVGSPFSSSLKLMPSTSYSGCSGISNLRLPSSFDDERSAVDDGAAGRRSAHVVQVLNGATATGWRSAGIDARKPSLHPSSVRATQS